MSPLLRTLWTIIIFIAVLVFFMQLQNNTSVEMTSDSNGGTLTTTDAFGNKQTCRTIIVGGTSRTTCN